jgi:hypothetical protein
LGYEPKGHNYRTLKRYASAWSISTEHCWGAVAAQLYRGIPRPDRRKVPRPSYDQLISDLASMSCCSVGRKYGVSDNAVRKWLRSYERERERKEVADDLPLAA